MSDSKKIAGANVNASDAASIKKQSLTPSNVDDAPAAKKTLDPTSVNEKPKDKTALESANVNGEPAANTKKLGKSDDVYPVGTTTPRRLESMNINEILNPAKAKLDANANVNGPVVASDKKLTSADNVNL